MLQLENVRYSYGERKITYPDWSVPEGANSLILGDSGSGKTTLLHLIGGLMKVTDGKLQVADRELASLSSHALDKFRANTIGIIFQKPHLVRSLTVKENLMLAQTLTGQKVNGRKVEETLAKLDILELKGRKVHQISQGQSQRVSIARAVINDPKLLLADEPTASLDDGNCERVVELLKAQAAHTKTTLIVATHDQRVKGAFENKLIL